MAHHGGGISLLAEGVCLDFFTDQQLGWHQSKCCSPRPQMSSVLRTFHMASREVLRSRAARQHSDRVPADQIRAAETRMHMPVSDWSPPLLRRVQLLNTWRQLWNNEQLHSSAALWGLFTARVQSMAQAEAFANWLATRRSAVLSLWGGLDRRCSTVWRPLCWDWQAGHCSNSDWMVPLLRRVLPQLARIVLVPQSLRWPQELLTKPINATGAPCT